MHIFKNTYFNLCFSFIFLILCCPLPQGTLFVVISHDSQWLCDQSAIYANFKEIIMSLDFPRFPFGFPKPCRRGKG